MADAYVNFHSRLDAGGYTRGAQAFQGAGSGHRAAAAVGASAGAPTAVEMAGGTEYAEIKVTSGSVFACILASDANEAARTAARIRIDGDDGKVVLSKALGVPASLFLWAAA